MSEVENGDCELVIEGGQPIRRVHFINISITAEFDGEVHNLIEDRQVFNEGRSNERTRKRRDLNGSVKEKIHSSEDPEDAVVRAIEEELGVGGDIDYESDYSEDMDKESPSFPGLRTQYRAHYFKAELKGDQIRRERYKEVQSDKITYFVWD
ncbi:MAG: NUDIX domain-containing protein [Patescibacteria group bacterium]